MGAWAGRFRAAAAACCAAVAVLIGAGVVAGLTLNTTGTSSISASFPGVRPVIPRGQAVYARSQALFAGANALTALLVVVAMLLVVAAAAESDANEEIWARRTRRAALVLAGLIVIGALAMSGVTIWYARVTNVPVSFGTTLQRLAGTLSAAAIAAAAFVWARRDVQASPQP